MRRVIGNHPAVFNCDFEHNTIVKKSFIVEFEQALGNWEGIDLLIHKSCYCGKLLPLRIR